MFAQHKNMKKMLINKCSFARKKEQLSQGKKGIVEKPLSCCNVDAADVKACRKCEKMFIKNLLEKKNHCLRERKGLWRNH
jgi:hypothetical protein